MKNLNKILLLISALSLSSLALAEECYVESDVEEECCEERNWVVGLDYYQAWRGLKGSYKHIYPKNFPGGTFYVGGKWDCLGLELGYDSSINAKKSWTLGSGARINNFSTVNTLHGTTSVRFSGLHIDVLGYLPRSYISCVEVFGAIGYGRVNGLRLGLGCNYLLTESFGVRAKVGYEHNSSVRVVNLGVFQNAAFNRKPFTHATTLSLGAFVRF